MIEFTETAIGLVGALARPGAPEMPMPCRLEVLGADRIRGIDAASWDRLAANALDDNPWLTRQMVLADMDAFGSRFRTLVLYRHGSEELIGLLPFRVMGGAMLGVGAPALNLYQVCGAPLISAEHAAVAVPGLLSALRWHPGLPRYWRFPHVVSDGGFVAIARKKAGAAGLATHLATPYRRAVLTDDAGSFQSHCDRVIGRKRVKDIERNIRRLGREGAVEFERVDAADAVEARVEDFLRLEASGWKGRRRTAFLSDSRHAEFARRAFGGTGEVRGLASVDSLLVDGKPVAVSINIAAGETLFTPKCAFNEDYRRFGPGMILEYKVIERFHAERAYRRMDAATTANGHVIDQLWGRTRAMGTLVVGPEGPVAGWLANALDGFADGKARLKSMLGRT